MPTKKISDLPRDMTCRDPSHKAPTMMVYEPGVYRHTCPSCGASYTFTIAPPMLSGHPPHPSSRAWNVET